METSGSQHNLHPPFENYCQWFLFTQALHIETLNTMDLNCSTAVG